MDVTEIVELILSGLGGGVLLKLTQVYLAHRRAVDGDFSERHVAARDNFQLVIDSLTERIKHLEISEQECRSRNSELEDKIRDLETQIGMLTARMRE